MRNEMLNGMTMNVNLKRIEICDLMIACTCAEYSANDGGKKWKNLHDKLEQMLNEFDAENFNEEV